jgi:hypothetical protein
MSAQNDYRSELDMWADMWSEMEKTDDFRPTKEKPVPAPYSAGRTAQDHFYDYFDAENDADPSLIQEEKVANPVYPDSVGPDHAAPKPAWVSDGLLREVEALKNRLFKVENQMARLGQGKKHDPKKIHSMSDKSMFSEIRAIRDRLDRVSSQLGIKDERTPWQIKRD